MALDLGIAWPKALRVATRRENQKGRGLREAATSIHNILLVQHALYVLAGFSVVAGFLSLVLDFWLAKDGNRRVSDRLETFYYEMDAANWSTLIATASRATELSFSRLFGSSPFSLRYGMFAFFFSVIVLVYSNIFVHNEGPPRFWGVMHMLTYCLFLAAMDTFTLGLTRMALRLSALSRGIGPLLKTLAVVLIAWVASWLTEFYVIYLGVREGWLTIVSIDMRQELLILLYGPLVGFFRPDVSFNFKIGVVLPCISTLAFLLVLVATWLVSHLRPFKPLTLAVTERLVESDRPLRTIAGILSGLAGLLTVIARSLS